MKLFCAIVCATTLVFATASPLGDQGIHSRSADCQFSPHCDSTGEAKVPIPCKGFCHQYFFCKDGKFKLTNCGFLQNFNNTARECQYTFKNCDWWMEKPTTLDPDNPTGHPGPTEPSKNPTEGPTSATTVPVTEPTTPAGPCIANANCDATGTERKPIPCANFCNKYYLCTEGNFTIKSCGTDLNFNPITRQCSYYFTQCDWFKHISNPELSTEASTAATTPPPSTPKPTTAPTTPGSQGTSSKPQTNQANSIFNPTISLLFTVVNLFLVFLQLK